MNDIIFAVLIFINFLLIYIAMPFSITLSSNLIFSYFMQSILYIVYYLETVFKNFYSNAGKLLKWLYNCHPFSLARLAMSSTITHYRLLIINRTTKNSVRVGSQY